MSEPRRTYIRPPSVQTGLKDPATINTRVRALQLVTVLLALVAWETAVRKSLVDPLFVPAPTAVAPALLRIAGPALAALADTLGKPALAYLLSVTLGVGAGLVVGSVRLLRDVLSPYVIALYGIPKILVLPWIVLLLGYGTAPAILYGAIHGLFPIVVLVTFVVFGFVGLVRSPQSLGRHYQGPKPSVGVTDTQIVAVTGVCRTVLASRISTIRSTLEPSARTIMK